MYEVLVDCFNECNYLSGERISHLFAPPQFFLRIISLRRKRKLSFFFKRRKDVWMYRMRRRNILPKLIWFMFAYWKRIIGFMACHPRTSHVFDTYTNVSACGGLSLNDRHNIRSEFARTQQVNFTEKSKFRYLIVISNFSTTNNNLSFGKTTRQRNNGWRFDRERYARNEQI